MALVIALGIIGGLGILAGIVEMPTNFAEGAMTTLGGLVLGGFSAALLYLIDIRDELRQMNRRLADWLRE